jgi:hypothetical protein
MNRMGQAIVRAAQEGDTNKFRVLASARLELVKELRKDNADPDVIYATTKPLIVARQYGKQFAVVLPWILRTCDDGAESRLILVFCVVRRRESLSD